MSAEAFWLAIGVLVVLALFLPTNAEDVECPEGYKVSNLQQSWGVYQWECDELAVSRLRD